MRSVTETRLRARTNESYGSRPGYHRREPMQRVDLYIKVEVILEEEEKPERVASEICRQLEKLYVVRSAELSHIQTRD